MNIKTKPGQYLPTLNSNSSRTTMTLPFNSINLELKDVCKQRRNYKI